MKFGLGWKEEEVAAQDTYWKVQEKDKITGFARKCLYMQVQGS